MEKKQNVNRYIFWMNVLCVMLVLIVNIIIRRITVVVIDTADGVKSVEVVKKYTEYFPLLTKVSVLMLLSTLVITLYLKNRERLKNERRAIEFASYFKSGQFNIIDLSNAKDDNEKVILTSWNKCVNEISELNANREHYFKGMVHDFKMPIQILRSNNDLLKLKYGNNKYIEGINDVISKLDNDTSKILYLDKIKYFEKPNIREVDVYELVFEMVETYGLEKDITISKPNFPILIESDREMLDKILQNVIDNGIKYKSEGQLEINMCETSLTFINKTTDLVHTENIYSQKEVKNCVGSGLGNQIVYEYAQLIGIDISSVIENSYFIVKIKF